MTCASRLILLGIDVAGGWAAFVVSITLIGVMTALIGDLAMLFGCTINLKDSVNAITFVAMGTSLPGTIGGHHDGDWLGRILHSPPCFINILL